MSSRKLSTLSHKNMNLKSIIALSAVLAVGGIYSPTANADEYTAAMTAIARKNPSIAAAKQRAEADKEGNMTGLTLANPEGSVAYQLGSPSGVYPRTTVELSQTFDPATVSGAKRRVAEARNRVADSSMALGWRDLLARTDAQMTEVVYRHRLLNLYDNASEVMKGVWEAAQKSYNAGNINIVDLNAVRMDFNQIEADARLAKIEYESSLATLSQIAGGEKITWPAENYMNYSLPLDFEAWSLENLGRDPNLGEALANAEVADNEINLSRKEGLPSISLGYAGEFVNGANYNGVSVGFDLPLWANRGKVKAARAAKSAAMSEYEARRNELVQSQRNTYDKGVKLAKYALETAKAVKETNNRESVEKLYRSGQISVHEYLALLRPLLDNARRVIDSEHDYQAALAELRALTPMNFE